MTKPLSRRFSVRYWLALTVLWAVWLGTGFVLVPALIRDAYEGASISILNRMISGQAQHPVDHYLQVWAGIAAQVTVMLLIAGISGYLLIRFRAPLGAFATRAWRIWHGPKAVMLRPAELLLVAIWFGLLAGLIEGATVISRRAIAGYPAEMYSPDVIWMAPLAAAVVFGVLGLGLFVLALRWPNLISLRTAVFTFGLIAVYALLRPNLGGVYWVAAAVLAIGIAVRASAFVDSRAMAFLRLVRWTTVAAVIFIVVTAPGMPGLDRLNELRAIGRLSAPQPGAPNVLLIILDTVRAQSLSLYGYDRPTTPNLERLAKRGVVFDRALAPAPWTLPSHASLFTGRWHHELSTDWQTPLDGADSTLAEVLSAHGYVTGGFVANLVFCTEFFGLNRGFLHYEDYPTSLKMIAENSWLSRRIVQRIRSEPGRLAHKTAGQVNRAFLKWISRVDDRPFFAFLNYMDAHEPYKPPEPFNLRFAERQPMHSLRHEGYEYSVDELQELRSAYDGAIAYIDHEIGLLLDELEQRGLLDNTVLIITSDHGEEFGEHRVVGHSHSLYLPSLLVPLVIVYPERVPAGIRLSDPVSLRHIAATVADLVSLPVWSSFPGTSLTTLWKDADDQPALATEPVLSQLTVKEWKPPDWYPIARGPMHSLVSGTLHYIRGGDGREELYDIDNDPWETTDLSPTAEGRRMLVDLRESLERYLSADPIAQTQITGARRLLGASQSSQR